MNRYFILISAVVMQMCLGATYSWSVYVKPLRDLTGLNQGPTQLPFTVFYFAFPATMIFSGTLLPRLGPRRSAMIGGLIFGSGWLLAALGSINFVFTVLGIGLLAGIGVGLAYIVPLAVCIQWFPRHKGLVTGIAVAGFGGGAALVSQIGGWIMSRWGVSPFQTFALFGMAFLLLVSGAGSLMCYRPEVAARGIIRLSFAGIIKHKTFQVLYIAMFTGLAAGFAVNANLKEFSPLQNVSAGILAVSLFAIANALGRITWGLIFDRIASATAIRANLVFQALILVGAIWLLTDAIGLWIFAFLTGFNYGGVLVVYASSTARIWGDEQVGQVYGLLFSSNIPAALSPLMAGFAYDVWGNFDGAIAVLAVLMGGATLWVWLNAPIINQDAR